MQVSGKAKEFACPQRCNPGELRDAQNALLSLESGGASQSQLELPNSPEVVDVDDNDGEGPEETQVAIFDGHHFANHDGDPTRFRQVDLDDEEPLVTQ
jgi:hypothetical protein